MVQSLILLLPLILLGVQAAPEPQVKLGPAPKGCSKFEIIVARGTSEPGPFGSIVGDPLVRAVDKAVPGSRGYACQYPATTDLKHSAGLGMDDVINRLNTQAKACPEQHFALVGYSQGAGVVHGIFQGESRTYPGSKGKLPVLENDVIPKILAIVTFGDPGFMGETNPNPRAKLVFPIPKGLEAKTMINCSHGDPVFVIQVVSLVSLYTNNE